MKTKKTKFILITLIIATFAALYVGCGTGADWGTKKFTVTGATS